MSIKKNLDDIVYDNICQGFVGGAYVAGMRLDPAVLAAEFQVSRTPVVQALKRMSNEHITEVTKGGKYIIPVATKETVTQICEARLLFEENALCTLCDVITEDQLIILQYMAGKCSQDFQEESFDDYFLDDLKFHRKIVEFAGNEVLNVLFETLMNRYMVIRATGGICLRHSEEACREHGSIVEALGKRSKKDVRQIIRKHLGAIQFRLETSENGK
ncbi:MAG: GntR family transcriptional regulator [Blautia sp.]|nr:GntR family transcriptional regulator [Blautia sp.]MDY5032762.1 GntR family transcriptional regulator [Blautia sp.]